MILVTLDEFLMGQRNDLSPELLANAERTVLKVNQLLALYEIDNPGAVRPKMASGYRSPARNAATPNASRTSEHMRCNASDLRDMPCLIGGRMQVRPLSRWCFWRKSALEDLDLWMEDPRCTGGTLPWAHFQTVPPRSGNRFFIPSTEWAERLNGVPLTLESIV